MYVINEAQQEVIRLIKKAFGKSYTPAIDELAKPPSPAMGDVAYPCFAVAKKINNDPVNLATELAAKIAPEGFVKKVEAKGPYVNFYFDYTKFGDRVFREVDLTQEKYGQTTSGQDISVVVEYASVNTHKEFHVGHLRNVLVGQFLVNIMQANAYDVTPVAYIGDVGAHIAKCIWGIEKFYDGKLDVEKTNRTKFLQEAYTKTTQHIEIHPEAKDEVAKVQQDVEAGERKWVKLWRETREWSLDDFKRVFSELNIKLDKWNYESEVENEGKKIVRKLLDQGIAKISQGAAIIDLEEFDLGAFLILKSDGAALYSTKDLALAFRREKEFHSNRTIYIIDSRQSLYMKQLFKALELAGFSKELVHLPYEFVTLKEGAMSSRKGNIIKYDDFRDAMIELAYRETKKRHEDWNDKKINEVSKKIAFAALRFGFIKQDLDKMITFDLAESLSFDGCTGPYLLYTIARINGIFRKTKVKNEANAELLVDPYEKQLIAMIAEYPEVIRKIGNTYQLSILPQYLFGLAQLFADFYHNVPVMQADPETRLA